jgi:hypothetical protein
MDNLRDHNIDLTTYIKAMGGLSLKHNKRAVDDIDDIEEPEVPAVPEIVQSSLLSCTQRDSVGGADLRNLRQQLHDINVPAPATQLTLDQGYDRIREVLSTNGRFELSPTQQRTESDGNCLFHALMDQLSYHQGLQTYAIDHQDLRARIVHELSYYIMAGRFVWHDLMSPLEWQRSMSVDSFYGDNNVLHLAAQIFNRPIILVPFHPEDAHNPAGTIEFHPRDPSNNEPIFLMWFSERGFYSPHFQSIRPRSTEAEIIPAIEALEAQENISISTLISISMDFGNQSSLLSLPSICDSSPIPPPQLQSTTMSSNNTTTNNSKKRKNREESYMNESNIHKGSRKRQCRRY